MRQDARVEAIWEAVSNLDETTVANGLENYGI